MERGSIMDNTKLKYISTVAKYNSITRAAEALYITPSALSKFIKKIEDEEHNRLFDRVGKKFYLTYAGERYLFWLRQIQSLYVQMGEEMNDISKSYSGKLKVGVQIDGANLIIDQVFPLFYQEFPNVLIQLYEEISNELRERLEDNLLDFAIIPDQQIGTSLESIPLAHNYRTLVVSKGNEVTKLATPVPDFPYPWIDLKEIQNMPFIAPFPEQDAYRTYDDIAAEGLKLNIIANIHNLASQLRCTADGIGFTITYDKIVKTTGFLEQVELLSFGNRNHMGNMVIAYNKSHYLNRTAKYFINLVKDAYTDNVSPNGD